MQILILVSRSVYLRPVSKLLNMNEQLAIFELFQHSKEIILKFFHHIIDLVCQLGPSYILKPHTNLNHPSIARNLNSRLNIPKLIKAFLLRNVLQVVNFKMKFTRKDHSLHCGAYIGKTVTAGLSSSCH
ncbi:uncharacterized protein VP01_1078g2 [Puccinia sorghi]|uniref:Uncharacterized protein n=1 Tax=Puccinia sorghi TaxID=27349 RepID=A0A0L6VTG5_9BASI|nr:uncharacterized protein VP01_1078g2 [Puccinia sorghi]